ncbi:MAG: F0F1 ATP synthase subunit B' [Rhizobiales bacterium]|nr:F0F1 ATP synthase subunit B' [Hyphomicrobiales bacterium]
MATNAHTEAPGGAHKGPFPPFNAETFASQLVWLAIIFVALYLLAARVALPRVASILESRRDRIAGDLAEAQRLKTESDEALATYEKSLADARSRAQTLANQMREQQNAQAEAARKALEQSLNAKLAEAEKFITVTKAAAMGSVRGIAADTAGAIVARMIGSPPRAAAVEAAVDDVLKG